MKIFFLKLFLFLLCFVCLDQLFGFVFSKFYNRVKSGTSYTTNYALRESKEDILIFGASEVSHGLISTQISNNLKMTCYNLGMNGQSIYHQYAILKELLKRDKPEIIIISTFILHEDEKTSLAPLYPYYYNYPSIREIVQDIYPREKYKLLIRGYANNSLLLNVIQGNFTSEADTKGYKPIYSDSKNLKLSLSPFKIGLTNRTMKYFDFFLMACTNANCKVYVVYTPIYESNIDIDENLKIRGLLKKYSVTYLNFATDTTFLNHPNLFKDRTHLNNKGATIFTNLITHELAKGLDSNLYLSNHLKNNPFR